MRLSLPWSKRQEVTVGIDLGADTTKLVCLHSNGADYKLIAHALLKREQMGNLIEFLHHSSLKKARVRFAIQAPQIRIQPLTIPIVPPEEMEAVVSWSFKEAANLNVDDYIIRFCKKDIEAGTNNQKITAFGIEKSFFEQWLKFIGETGVGSPDFAEPDIQSLANLIIYNNQLQTTDRYAVIDIGRSQSQLAIVSRSGIEFYRSFSGLGGDALVSSISQELGVESDQAERLAMRMSAEAPSEHDDQIMDVVNGFCAKLCVQAQYAIETYNAVPQNLPITNILLAGGGAKLIGLKDLIQETLHFPTDIVDPFKKLNLGKFRGTDFESYKSLYAIAAGLAL